MIWNYNNGEWYTNEAGNSIFYIENNPCKCCPGSYFVEYRSPVTQNRNVRFDVFSHDELQRIISYRKLIRLTHN